MSQIDTSEIPETGEEWFQKASLRFELKPPPKTILTITPDGKWMRGNREVKDLPREELLILIDELIDLIRQR